MKTAVQWVNESLTESQMNVYDLIESVQRDAVASFCCAVEDAVAENKISHYAAMNKVQQERFAKKP